MPGKATICRNQTHQKQAAYTLLELAMVITIIAFLIGGTISIGVTRIESQRIESTKKRIALIESALKQFAEQNGYLPCPADGTLVKTNANYGVQANNTGVPWCRTGTPTVNFNNGNRIVGGVVPVTSLGLPAEVMYDAWGRKFTYALDVRYTVAQNPTFNWPSSLTFNGPSSQCGDIKIKDEKGQILSNNVAYAIISHGEDGFGAFLDNGTRLLTANSNISSIDNANPTSFDEIFRSHRYQESATDKLNRYDDIVSYKTRGMLHLNLDTSRNAAQLGTKPTSEGWVYVPEYTLPSGLKVPAFEVMKYEASETVTGSGVPQSIANVLPLSGKTFVEARRYCQMLDKKTANPNGRGALMEYDIISETQWLSLANQLAENDVNWLYQCKTQDSAGVFPGHVDNDPSSALRASIRDDLDLINASAAHGPYFGTNNTQNNSAWGKLQRRTLQLPNGSVLWDFSGNLQEWSYCDLPDQTNTLNGHKYTPCNSDGTAKKPTDFTYGAISGSGNRDYNVTSNYTVMGLDSDGFRKNILPPYYWSNGMNMGMVVASDNETGILRGGSYFSTTGNASDPGGGVFQLRLGQTTTSMTGFRCVHNYKKSAQNFSPTNLANLSVWFDAADLDGDGAREGTAEANLIDKASCPKTATQKNDACIQRWKNKAYFPGWFWGATTFDAVANMENGGLTTVDCTQGGGSSHECYPTLKLAGMNGLPVVNFDGAKPQWFDTYSDNVNAWAWDFETYSGFSIFVVANAQDYNGIISAATSSKGPDFVMFPYRMNSDITNANTNAQYVFVISDLMHGTDASNNYCHAPPAAAGCTKAGSGSVNYACAKLGGGIGGTDAAITGLTAGSSHVISGIFAGAVNNGLRAFVDGTVFHNTDSAVHAKNSPFSGGNMDASCVGKHSNLMIGSQRANHSDVYTKGDVAEIIIYNRELSNAERILVERYLASKWNIKYKGPAVE